MLALVGLELLPLADPPGSFALDVCPFAVVIAGKAGIVQDLGPGVVIEKPFGGRTVAGLTLELGAVPVAELLGVAFVRVCAH